LLVINPKNEKYQLKRHRLLGSNFDGTAQFNAQAKALPDCLLPSSLIGQFRIVKDHCRIFFLAQKVKKIKTTF